MPQRLVAGLLSLVLLTACGTTVDGEPCTIPGSRPQSLDCRTPTAKEALGAEMVIAEVDPPLSIAATERIVTATEPGLSPVTGYFTVPSDEGPVTSGRLSLEPGLDQLVASVGAAFAEDGRTGVESLVIYGVGFAPSTDEPAVAAAIDLLAAEGMTIYLCTLPAITGGCSLTSP